MLPTILLYSLFISFLTSSSSQTISTSIDEDLTSNNGDLNNKLNTNNDDDEVQFINLSELNNTALEHICISRGFELIPSIDPITNQILEFTHEDYVEAAQQCLDVEAEMEKVIKQNPNIIDDLKKERERMELLRAKLEAEILEKQKEIEKKRSNDKNYAFSNQTNTTMDVNSFNQTMESNHSDAQKVEFDDILEETVPLSKKADRKIQLLSNNSNSSVINEERYNPMSFKNILRESLIELREKISRDVQIVSNIFLPPWIRDSIIQQVLLPCIKVSKISAAAGMDLMNRYIKVALQEFKKLTKNADYQKFYTTQEETTANKES